MHSHTQDVKSVAWHPEEDVLASCSYDDTVRLYERLPGGDDWRCSSTLTGHASTVWGVCFTADGRGLVSCSDDRSIILWEQQDAGYAETARLRDVHERAIYTLSWTGGATRSLGRAPNPGGRTRASPRPTSTRDATLEPRCSLEVAAL